MSEQQPVGRCFVWEAGHVGRSGDKLFVSFGMPLGQLTVIDQLSRVFQTYSFGIDSVTYADYCCTSERLVGGVKAGQIGRTRRQGKWRSDENFLLVSNF